MFKLTNKFINSSNVFKIALITAAISFSVCVYAEKLKISGPLNLGRLATTDEVHAWDIDVRPDFKGLPKGKGNVEKGEKLWIEQCASCHGDFGESSEVFNPIVGGTTKEDIKSGRVANLVGDKHPQRTSVMKINSISTFYDYINRAMPWNAPRSLSPDDVYALVAYIMNLAEVVPADFELSDTNIADVQKLLPNRNGMTLNHGMWTKNGKADVHNVACMTNCSVKSQITSFLPDYAKDAHGDISKQNREYGPVRGVPLHDAAKVLAGANVVATPESLLQKHACFACHQPATRTVGPSYKEIAGKYGVSDESVNKLVKAVKAGSVNTWGAIPMPPNPAISDEDIAKMIKFILATK